MTNQIVGRHGEDAAANFLQKIGFRILARNLKLKIGEVDLLCQQDQTIVLVEVKSGHSTDSEFSPLLKIDGRKRRKLAQLAYVVAAKYPNQLVRVDVVIVILTEPAQIIHYPSILEFR